MAKEIFTRIIQKHDTESAWSSSTAVPDKGELIVYDPDEGKDATEQLSRIKIGDGVTLAKDLPFVTDKVIQDVTEINAPSDHTPDVYRLTKGVFLQSGMKMYDSDCIVRDTTPNNSETGECFIRISSEGDVSFAGYYVTTDKKVWCYLDTDKMTSDLNNSDLSDSDKSSIRAVILLLKTLNISTKWRTIEDVSKITSSLGDVASLLSWGGVVTSIEQIITEANSNKTYLYIYEEMYSYKNGAWVSGEDVVYPGVKPGAEVFNSAYNTAGGIASHAEGIATSATGLAAHAEGKSTEAHGDGAHSEGIDTHALNNGAHTEGEQTNAYGTSSHAEGYQTEANGQDAHAEGSLTKATGDHAHAEGYKTVARGPASHASGIGTIAQGNYQTAIGTYNVADYTSAFIIGNGGLNGSTEIRSNALTIDWEGNANFLGKVTTGGKEVLTKSDYVTAGRKAGSAVGEVSTAEGVVTIASGVGSHAEGGETQATGPWSHSEGYGSKATGNSAHASGINTTASGDYSHAEGELTTAYGKGSHAGGYKTTATGEYQTVIGKINKQDDSKAFIVGGGYKITEGPTAGVDLPVNLATIDWSGNAEFQGTIKAGGHNVLTALTLPKATTAEQGVVQLNDTIYDSSTTMAATANAVKIAYDTACANHTITSGKKIDTTLGIRATAEGYSTTASGDYSHAEGHTTTASGDYSHAEGYLTHAEGPYSHAEGYNCVAEGECSHAQGKSCVAHGEKSFATGWGTSASAMYQTAIGRHNVPDVMEQYAFIIGNGSLTELSNALTVSWGGELNVAGNVISNGTNLNDLIASMSARIEALEAKLNNT